MEHSKMFEKVKSWYNDGIWTADMVKKAVPKLITQEECDEILGAN